MYKIPFKLKKLNSCIGNWKLVGLHSRRLNKSCRIVSSSVTGSFGTVVFTFLVKSKKTIQCYD